MQKALWILAAVILVITAIYAQSHNFFTVRIAHTLLIKEGATLDVDGTTDISGATTLGGATTVSGAATFSSSADFDGAITAGSGFWASAPSIASNDMSTAFFYTENFIGVDYDTSSAGDSKPKGWITAGDDGYVFAGVTGTLGGVQSLTAVTGSNNEAYTQLGELGTETYLEYTISSGNQSWLEVNFAINDDDDAANWILGLANEGAAAGNLINDAGTDIADIDFVGIMGFEANPDTLRLMYQTTGSAFVSIDSILIDSAAYHTFGVKFDGDSTVSYYWDNTVVGTVLTSASGFPDTEELSLVYGVKNGAADRTIILKWIKFTAEW